MPPYVLDTSALMAVFEQEDGALEVLEIVEDASDERPRVYLPFMSLMEFEYLTRRNFSAAVANEALRMLRSWPLDRMESFPEWGSRAAWVKSRASLSVADAWNAALALILDAELVHKDPEFDRVPDLKHRRLPYKEKNKKKT
jgi:predicted nucleic acid-binding protein